MRNTALTALGLLAVCVLLSKPLQVSAQTIADDAEKRTVMKIEESSHNLTPENRETQQVIVSKVYDSGDSLGNSYIVRLKDAKKAVVIDPGYNYEAIGMYLDRLGVDLEAIMLTNGYFLRIAGNEELRKKWPAATILIGEKDAGLLTDPKANMSDEFGGVTSPTANVLLNDGKSFEIAGVPFYTMATPGHTPGSMTYILAADDSPIAFTGDFLYKEGISSASLPSSNEDDLQASLDRFLESQYAQTLIFPGYGDDTSVSEFYTQLTGKSISVIDSGVAADDSSPIIIIERDPATVVVTEPVYIPTVEYRTETIVVDRYVRPWLSVGVSIPLWSHGYRPWYDYRSYYHRPLPPPPIYRPPYHGGYRPPPIIPPRPGQPGLTPGQVGPNRPGQGLIPGQGPNRPGLGLTPGERPNRPGQGLTPGEGPNRPWQGLTPSTRPVPGTQPSTRPVPGTQPSTRPVPGTQPSTRPVPGTQPSTRPVPGTQPSTRPVPGTQPSTRPVPGTQPSTRPVPGTQPSTRPVPGTQPSTRPVPGTNIGTGRPAVSTTPPRPSTATGTTTSRPTITTPATRPTTAPTSRPTTAPTTRPATGGATSRPAAAPTARPAASTGSRPAASAATPRSTTAPTARPAASTGSRPAASAATPRSTTAPTARPAAGGNRGGAAPAARGGAPRAERERN